MLYSIIIKSHCEAPDYEDQVIAKSRMKAAKKFLAKINTYSEEGDWGMTEILENMDYGENL
jgi:hypothetical protein